MKRWFILLITILVLTFNTYGVGEIQHYRKYVLSLYKLGMKDLAKEKLTYAIKKFGKIPVLLNVKDIIEGRKPLKKKQVIIPEERQLVKKIISPPNVRNNIKKSKTNWSWLKKKLHTFRYYSYFLASIGAFFVLPPL